MLSESPDRNQLGRKFALIVGLSENEAMLMRVAQRVIRAMSTTERLQQLLFAGQFSTATKESQQTVQETNESETKLEAKVIQLPMWPDPQRAAPSALLRSALFSVGRRGPRRQLDDETLASWSGTSIRYKGDQLDQYDEAVWLQALHLFRLQDLKDGQPVRFTSRSFLKSLGKSMNGKAAVRLHKSLLRMTACAVTVDIGGKEYFGNLLNGARDKTDGRYAVKLTPELRKLFDAGMTRLDWDTRRKLKTDLARWLHSYVQSHRAKKNHPHRISVSRVRELCGSEDESLKSFRQKLRRSITQLEANSVVLSWRITKNDALEFVRLTKGT